MSRRRRRILIGLAATGGGFVLLVLTALIFLTTLPGVGDAPDRVQSILTVHGATGTTITRDLKVARAVVAVEDQRFYAHPGVDLQAVVRAVWRTVAGDDDPGGATISQQLAKVLYTGDGGFGTKLRQIGLAVKLERAYTKDRILDLYMNAIYYGAGAYGIGQAAHRYFAKDPRDLDWAEASLVAGLPQAPSAYNPFENLALAKRRQRHVLDRLVATGALTASEADTAYGERLQLVGGGAG